VILGATAQTSAAWTLSNGGVWDIPNQQRFEFDPEQGQIGNMGASGLRWGFNQGATVPPQTAQAGADDAIREAFDLWDVGGLPVRIKFTEDALPDPNCLILFVGINAPGTTSNALVNFNPRNIIYHLSRTLRTDGWSLDLDADQEVLIDEYDILTTGAHEVGHLVGLGHSNANVHVMTPQDLARTAAGGSWEQIEQVAPFGGQPLDLDDNPIPNGTLAYFEPRDTLTYDDRQGAITLYSAPQFGWITNSFPAPPPLPPATLATQRYSHEIENLSAADAGYRVRELALPVASSLPVERLTAPPGWTITRDASHVRVETSGEGLAPGETLTFAFDSLPTSGLVTPVTRWRIHGLEIGSGGPTDLTGDDGPPAVPVFDWTDFAVLGDGLHTYEFDAGADAWQIVPTTPVPVPVEPGSVPALRSPAALALVAFRVGVGLWVGRSPSLRDTQVRKFPNN
jgi:hypothetical protein